MGHGQQRDWWREEEREWPWKEDQPHRVAQRRQTWRCCFGEAFSQCAVCISKNAGALGK